MPQHCSEKAAGYDLHSLNDYDIPPQNIGLINTGIAAKFPEGTYSRIASQSGLILHHSITVMGSVIDPDYTGKLKVLLYIFGTTNFNVHKNDQVAQLMLERYSNSPIKVTEKLDPIFVTATDLVVLVANQSHILVHKNPRLPTKVPSVHLPLVSISFIATLRTLT